MKILRLKISILGILSFIMVTTFCFSQQGRVSINQDKKITELLSLKKEINKEDINNYKILIFEGGKQSEANAIKNNFLEFYPSLDSRVDFETPNFKVYVGNFKTKLEADRFRKNIKKNFPLASEPMKLRKHN